MVLSHAADWVRFQPVLLALRSQSLETGWLEDVNTGLQPAGYAAYGTFCDPEAVRRVELGGLAAAVLFAEGATVEGFSLLRIIRSIDANLPCWLVTDDPTPQTLRMALALQVQGVIKHPVEPSVLSFTVTKGLEQFQ